MFLIMKCLLFLNIFIIFVHLKYIHDTESEYFFNGCFFTDFCLLRQTFREACLVRGGQNVVRE